MKRLMVILVLAAVISTLLTACSSAEPKVYSDPTQTISADVGQEFIIALKDQSGSTGYSWREEFDESFLKLVGSGYESPPEPKRGEPPLVGAPGTRSFQFKALKKGETKVTMVCKQPWEGGGVGETKVFTVSIS